MCVHVYMRGHNAWALLRRSKSRWLCDNTLCLVILQKEHCFVSRQKICYARTHTHQLQCFRHTVREVLRKTVFGDGEESNLGHCSTCGPSIPGADNNTATAQQQHE